MNFIKVGPTTAKPVQVVIDLRLKEFCFGSCTIPLKFTVSLIEMFHDPGDVRMPLFTTKERTPTCSDL